MATSAGADPDESFFVGEPSPPTNIGPYMRDIAGYICEYFVVVCKILRHLLCIATGLFSLLRQRDQHLHRLSGDSCFEGPPDIQCLRVLVQAPGVRTVRTSELCP